ncbi:LysR family transcriptional regulator [Primorskyibacter sp. 2E233]|uniref:LysR family transcriptional regulator n=1 Tax=Primorskyibacter sp. 2E233 TaxID=3413431 RepID=UPI003BF1978D
MSRYDHITFKQLRALAAVIQEGSITQAAEGLGLTGPAVHSQLKSLEDAVGSPLLVREAKKRMIPTPQGEALLQAHAEARAALGRACHTIEALDRGQIGRVVLGVVSTGKYFAPRIVARLRAAMPEVDIRLKVGNRSEILQALSEHRLDLCIMGRPPRDPLMASRVLAPHPHILIAAADHPLVGQGPVSINRLLDEVFVMREPGSGTRILATRYLDEVGQGREVQVIEMDSNETIKQSVMNGLGVALISAHTVADELATGRLVALDCPGLPIWRQWFLLTPSYTSLPATKRVRDWIAEHGKDALPALDF